MKSIPGKNTDALVSLDELALKESEERFRLIFENSPLGKSITGVDGSLLVNKAFCDILGYTEEELREKKWPEITHPDDIAESTEIVEELMKGNSQSVRYEKRYLNKNGKIVWTDVSTTLERDKDGKPAFFITIIVDISLLKESLEKRRISEGRYLSYIELTNQIVWVTNPEGLVVEDIPYFRKFTGQTYEDVRGTGWTSALHPDDIGKTIEVWEKAVAAKIPYETEYRVRRHDGLYRYLFAKGAPVFNDKGKITEWVGVCIDISERKEAEDKILETNEKLELKVIERTKELTESKRLLEETGRLARVGGWEIDVLSNKLHWSETTYEIHEVESGFMPDIESAINFYSPRAIPVITRCIEKAVTCGESFDEELDLITAKKNTVWVRAIGKSYSEGGRVVKVGGVFQDINARKLIEQELKVYREHLEELVNDRTRELDEAILNLQRSNQELEQFAYVASHDLQEPLRMVASYTQLLEKRYKDQLDDDARDFINYAVDGANRMQRLINDLLDYSRVTTRGKPLSKIDLSEVMGQAVANLHSRIMETGSMVINEDLPFAYGDEGQLIRVFQNLLENAMKFRGVETPRIKVASITTGDKIQISVTDNGIGIDMKYEEKIFTIFQRLHNKADYPGTGIGLAICKRTIERHGGKIWFTSEPGKGSTFYFTLKIK